MISVVIPAYQPLPGELTSSSPAISWFTEQTVLAFLMQAAGAEPLPPER